MYNWRTCTCKLYYSFHNWKKYVTYWLLTVSRIILTVKGLLVILYFCYTGQVNTLTKLLKNEKTPFFRNLVLLPLLVQQETDPDIQVNLLVDPLFFLLPFCYLLHWYFIQCMLWLYHFSGRKQLMAEYKHLTMKLVGIKLPSSNKWLCCSFWGWCDLNHLFVKGTLSQGFCCFNFW